MLHRILSSLTVIALLAAAQARAHHTWSVEYDVDQSRVIHGTVARVIFQNPHAAILLDVATGDGGHERWRIEWGNPQRLRDRGVTEQTVRLGDKLTVTGNPHRDPEEKALHAQSLRRASDGLQL